MKKTVCILLAAVMILLGGCGKKEINIIRNEEAIKPARLAVPAELEGHDYVQLLSFDGANGIFAVNREDADRDGHETAELVVYDVHKEKTVQYLTVNLKNGTVTDAMKQGDWLYYVEHYFDEGKYILKANNGLETVQLLETVTDRGYETGIYFEEVEGGFLVCSAKADIENERYVYSFYTLSEDGPELKGPENLHNYSSNMEMKILDVEYDRENNEENHELDLWEYSIEDDSKIFVYKWDGAMRETVFMGPALPAGFVKVMGDYVFHYSENTANGGSYMMLTVTDTVNNTSRDIDFVDMQSFVSINDSYAVYKYGTPDVNIVQIEISGRDITFTPVDIDFMDVTRQNIATSRDNCLIKVQRMDKPEVELYLLK